VHKYETSSLAGAASYFFLLLSSSRVVRVILYDAGLGLVRVMAYHSLAMIS